LFRRAGRSRTARPARGIPGGWPAGADRRLLLCWSSSGRGGALRGGGASPGGVELRRGSLAFLSGFHFPRRCARLNRSLSAVAPGADGVVQNGLMVGGTPFED